MIVDTSKCYKRSIESSFSLSSLRSLRLCGEVFPVQPMKGEK